MCLGIYVLLIPSVFIGIAHALFEDQIGKFDWSTKHLGCYESVVFDTNENGQEMLIATSKENAIGRINTNTGDLDWRQLGELNAQRSPRLSAVNSRAVVLHNNGEFLRVFDVHSGILKWQHMLALNNTSTDVKFAVSNRVIAVLDGRRVYGLLGKEKMTSKWTTKIDEDSLWTDVVIIGESIFVLGALKSGKEIRVLKLDAKTGGIEMVSRLAVSDPFFSINFCIIAGHFVVCSAGSTIFAGNFVAASEEDGSMKRYAIELKSSVLALSALRTSSGTSIDYFVAQLAENTLLFSVSDERSPLIEVLRLDRSNVFALVRNSLPRFHDTADSIEQQQRSESDANTQQQYLFAIYYSAQRLLKIFPLKKLSALKRSGVNIHVQAQPQIGGGIVSNALGGVRNEAPISAVHVIGTSDAFQILTVRRDCRADFYEAHVQLNQDATTGGTKSAAASVDAALEWVRFEALASISNVEMLDLPLSESQARIETEFGTEDESLWRMFFMRISSQLEELQRSFVTLSNRLTHAAQLLMSRRGVASPGVVLRHLFGYDERRPHRQRSATISLKEEALANRNLERDYFNLRKLIVVSTLTGSVYALSNDDGEVIWSLYLGEDMAPFSSQLGRPTVPLFIQRGTSLYQHASQAAVVFHSKHSKKSNIFVFNPVTGSHLTSLQVDNLQRVELMPFVVADAIRPLILVDDRDTLRFYPNVVNADYRPAYPVHSMYVRSDSDLLRGMLVDFSQKKLVEVWRSRLGFTSSGEKIVSVTPKPLSQQVHSQGKVLGDRSVLYKYANPNLVAIASLDDTEASMGIWLVDGVSGQMIYSARHSRVLAPIHLVHCENWLSYTYWNDKARRTEIGVIELYEGLDQTNAKHFSSFTTLKRPLAIFAQSYIFPQGVSAMAVSETEQGLSSRSLIVAMPFGGVLELSRRFVDARRPLEMTQELREEMVIPYIPELPVSTEDLINYNKSTQNVHGIRTAPSGLESTSLVFVYGLDLFYTRVHPSGTFDILKDDFDYVLISLVMIVLVVASVLSKRLLRSHTLKQNWA